MKKKVDRLCGLVARVPGCRSRGPAEYARCWYCNFMKCGTHLKYTLGKQGRQLPYNIKRYVYDAMRATLHASCVFLVACLAYSSILEMIVVCAPEDSTLHGHGCGNLASITAMIWLQNKIACFSPPPLRGRTRSPKFSTSLHITHCAANSKFIVVRRVEKWKVARSLQRVHSPSGQADLLTWNIHCKEHKRSSCTDCFCGRVAACTLKRWRADLAVFYRTSLAVKEDWRRLVIYCAKQVLLCQTWRVSFTASVV
jgi:hypothetical protein